MIPTYTAIKNNVAELITATKEGPQSLEDIYTDLLAAHDDDLTEDEKTDMDRRILDALKKKR